jgi:hypothetical protein
MPCGSSFLGGCARTAMKIGTTSPRSTGRLLSCVHGHAGPDCERSGNSCCSVRSPYVLNARAKMPSGSNATRPRARYSLTKPDKSHMSAGRHLLSSFVHAEADMTDITWLRLAVVVGPSGAPPTPIRGTRRGPCPAAGCPDARRKTMIDCMAATWSSYAWQPRRWTRHARRNTRRCGSGNPECCTPT